MTKLANFCQKFIQWGIIITLALIPLIFTTKLSSPFVFPKILFFRAIVTLMAGAWIIKIIEEKKRDFLKVKFALPIGLFLFAYILSTVFSIDKTASFWGINHLQTESLYTFVFYALFFFLIADNLRDRKIIKRAVEVVILASLPVSLYGILQHFGIDFISDWSNDVSSRIISSIGNPAYLGHYLIMIMPLTLAWFFLLKNFQKRIIVFLIFILQLAALSFTYSRAAWLGLAGGLFLFFLLWGLKKKNKLIWLAPLAVFLLISIFASVFYFNPSLAENFKENSFISRFASSFTLRDDTSLSRLTVWKTGWQIIKEKPILGHGPQTFIYTFNSHYPPSLLKYEKQDFGSAHNQLIDLAASHGILGLGIFLFLLAYFFYAAAKLFFRTENYFKQMLCLASLCSVSAFFIENQFIFANPVSYVYFYFFLGLVSSLHNSNEEEIFSKEKQKKARSSSFYPLVLIFVLTLVYLTSFLPLTANKYYQKAMASQSIEDRIYLLEQSVNSAGGLSFNLYYAKLSEEYLNLAKILYKKDKIKEAEKILKMAEELSQEIIAKQPLNIDFYLFLGNLYNYWGENIDPEKTELADQYYKKAIELAPGKQELYWHWGYRLFFRGRQESALEKFRQAVNLDPSVPEPYFKLAQIYKLMGQDMESEKYFQKGQELTSQIYE